jgi:DNA-binding HxlR family transcriptional regulator
MPIIEERLRLIIIDHKRIVVLLDDKAEELHGDMLEILLKFYQRQHRTKPWLLEPATVVTEPWVGQLEPVTTPTTPVLVPATENEKHVMPKGLTKRHHNKSRREEFAIPPVPGTGVLILRAIAAFDRPVKFRDVADALPQLVDGTIGPQLLKLYEDGYLTREKDATAKSGTTYFYSLTPAALDLLTRPDPQLIEATHDNGTLHDSRTTSKETRNNN